MTPTTYTTEYDRDPNTDQLLRILRERGQRAQIEHENGPLTVKAAREIVLEHAELSRPRPAFDSYFAVCLSVGGTVVLATSAWLAFGQWGASPEVKQTTARTGDAAIEWINATLFSATTIILLVLGAIVVGAWDRLDPGAPSHFVSRVSGFLGRQISNAVLLLGVAAIGVCAVVPGGLLVHAISS